MKLRRRSKKQTDETSMSLSLSIQDDSPLMVFPAKVIGPLRHMLGRVTRKGAFPARLAMVSSLRQEGVTYLAHALAATMAHDLEATICVVELNWQWPSAELASVMRNGGLTAVLTGESELEDVIIPTSLPNLSLLPAGDMVEDDRASFARSSSLKQVIEKLSEQFDHLVLDIPAILASYDAIPLASLGSDACLVVHQGVTSIDDAKLALDDIDHLSLLGVIMNKVHLETPSMLLKIIPQQ